MTEDELWRVWLETRRHAPEVRRLVGEIVLPHEYRHASFPHPSSYAYLELRCDPSHELSFVRGCDWPGAVGDVARQAALDKALAAGIIEALIWSTAGKNPLVRWACAITCTDLRWHREASSEIAFYRAAFGAITELIARGQWNATRLK